MTAYDMRISDWSSDVCSSDLIAAGDKTDTLQQVHRNRVDVDQIVARRGCHMALAVDEHQRAGRAKTAKIEDIEPGGADEAGRVALAEGRAQRRKKIGSAHVRTPVTNAHLACRLLHETKNANQLRLIAKEATRR